MVDVAVFARDLTDDDSFMPAVDEEYVATFVAHEIVECDDESMEYAAS